MKTFVVLQTMVTTYECTIVAKSEAEALERVLPNRDRPMARKVRRSSEKFSLVTAAPARNTYRSRGSQ